VIFKEDVHGMNAEHDEHGYQKPSKNNQKPSKTIKNHQKPSKNIKNHQKPSKTIKASELN